MTAQPNPIPFKCLVNMNNTKYSIIVDDKARHDYVTFQIIYEELKKRLSLKNELSFQVSFENVFNI
jgi:hypothetical protein